MSLVSWPRPTVGRSRPWQLPPTTDQVTDSGLRLIACDLSAQRLVNMRLALPLGATHDPTPQPGLSALTGRALLEGAGPYDAHGLVAALELLGATISIEPGYDVTTVVVDAPDDSVGAALRLLGLMLTRPRLPEAGVRRLIGEQVARLRQGAADPATRAERVATGHAFPGQRYGLAVDGAVEVLGSVAVTDVSAHAERQVRPDGALLVVAGAVDVETMADQVEAALSGWQGIAGPRRAQWAQADPGATLLDRPGSVQSAICLVRTGGSFGSPAYPALRVALSGACTFTGRLNGRLREERGYTYGVQNVVDPRPDLSVVRVMYTCETASTAAALDDTMDIFRGLAGNGLDDNERHMGRQINLEAAPLRLETAAAMAAMLESLAVSGHKPEEYTAQRAAMSALSDDDIDAAAADVFDPSSWCAAVVGDARRCGDVAKALGRPLPTEHDPLLAVTR